MSPPFQARRILQYVHPQHPPDKEYRNNGPEDVNDPVANGFRFPKIKHSAMVTGSVQSGRHNFSIALTEQRSKREVAWLQQR